MATPQEKRFIRLAQANKTLTREQLQTAITFQQLKEKEGSKIPIWDCTVLQNLLDQNKAEKLQTRPGTCNATSWASSPSSASSARAAWAACGWPRTTIRPAWP